MIRYYPADSVLHKANAKLKILSFLSVTLSAIALPFEYAFLLFPLAIVLFILVAKIPLKQAGWKSIASMALFVFVIRLFLTPQNGILGGVLNALYLAGVLLLVELLVKTTKPQDFRQALLGFGLPKRHAFMLTIALEAIPLFQAKAEKVRIAQTARGSKRKLLPMLIPLLHSLFERAKKLSIALEARGFSLEKL